MTPKIKWVKPSSVLGSSLAGCLKPKDMLADFIKHGLLTELTGNYSEDVYDMCRNGATWLAAHMAQIGLEVQVVEGTFLGQSHCWVVFGPYYFDMTIAQSDPSYPEFAVVAIKNAEGYSEFTRLGMLDWFKRAEKEAA